MDTLEHASQQGEKEEKAAEMTAVTGNVLAFPPLDAFTEDAHANSVLSVEEEDDEEDALLECLKI